VGGRIAFVSNRDGEPEIYTVPSGGGALIKVTNNAINDNSPTWSPDGTRIAYESLVGGNSNIYIMNADGTGTPTQLTSGNADHQPPGPLTGATSPSSGRRQHRAVHERSDGFNLIQITSTATNERFPAWSPTAARSLMARTRGAPVLT
jgi:TolB protein